MPDDPLSPFRDPFNVNRPFGSTPLPAPSFGGQTPQFQPMASMVAPATGSANPTESALKKIEEFLSAVEKMAAQNTLRPDRCAAALLKVQSGLAQVFGAKSKIVLAVADWKKDLRPPFDQQLFFSRVEQVRHFVRILHSCSEDSSLSPISVASHPPRTNSVFIIHGHDETNWLKLDRMLRTEFDLQPIVILRCQPFLDRREI